MKIGDFIWSYLLAVILLLLIISQTHQIFIMLTLSHPYIIGFTIYSVLATMGEFLAIRIVSNNWIKPIGMTMKTLIWGFLGICITAAFSLYPAGVDYMMTQGLLPGGESKFIFAFLSSAIMNLTFTPTMMVFHRLTDIMIDFYCFFHIKMPTFVQSAGSVDWEDLVSLVILKTIPFFWIPGHTITFLLPLEYRVLFAGLLSIASGAMLSYAKKQIKNSEKVNKEANIETVI